MKKLCVVLVVAAAVTVATCPSFGGDSPGSQKDRGKQSKSRPRQSPASVCDTKSGHPHRDAARESEPARWNGHHGRERGRPLVVYVPVSYGCSVRRYTDGCYPGYDRATSPLRTQPYSNYPVIQLFRDRGYDMGLGMRRGEVAWAYSVGYVRDYILEVDQSSLSAFRRGFLAGYGTGAASQFEDLMQAANW